MTLKDEVGYYLDNILDRLEDIANEEIRLLATIGVVRTVTDFLDSLKGDRNIYKGQHNGK
ncbi:MAG: hypothetical protein PHH29_17070 [Desulfuromonadaceae bacterium]|nr:hypothetical protein [Desulfuromonadaceae bacterium]